MIPKGVITAVRTYDVMRGGRFSTLDTPTQAAEGVDTARRGSRYSFDTTRQVPGGVITSR